jgi:hypothetical protein
MVIEEAQAGTRRPASSPIEARQPAIGQQVARDADASVRSPSPSASASVPVGCCPSPTARHRSPATSLVNVFLVENARARPRTDGRTYHALSLWLVATRPATGPPGLLDRRSRMNHPGSSLRRPRKVLPHKHAVRLYKYSILIIIALRTTPIITPVACTPSFKTP